MPPVILPLAAAAPPAVERLLDQAFGADRRGRTAYRLRDHSVPLADLSFAITGPDGGPAAVLQSWPVALVGANGPPVPLVLVGPVAVAPAAQGQGFGTALMGALLAAAGDRPLVLVGDPEYYHRFGFTADGTGGWTLPGPVERRRLLARSAGGLPAAAALVRGAPGPAGFHRNGATFNEG